MAKVSWESSDDTLFAEGKYSRAHSWHFDGISVLASSSPNVVPVPYSVEEAIDPEEALIAAASSCHMLFFLSIASERGFVIRRYMDNAEGFMSENEVGAFAISKIILRPKIEFVGDAPTHEEINKMHEESHANCFIANSLKTNISVAYREDKA